MSLLALQQVENAFALYRSSEPNGQAGAGFFSMTRAIERQFTKPIGEVFRTGDQLQRGALDLMLSAATLEAFTPKSIMKVALDAMQQSAQTLTILVPGRESRVIWQELKNKLQAFELFDHVESALRLPARAQIDLAELVKRAGALNPYLGLWAMEGVGHYYAERYWERSGTPRRLLAGTEGPALPRSALVPLHAGVGLSLAGRLLQRIKSKGPPAEVQDFTQHFRMLCEDNSRKGYAGVTFEALGVVARTLFPDLVPTISQYLSAMGGALTDFFWHGVGRGIYFAPTNFLPWCSAPWRALAMSQQEPPNESGRLNATAGLAFALTLVNIQQPEVLETFLAHHGEDLSKNDAFSNGVSSALMIWRYWTQDDVDFAAFREHQPCPCLPKGAALWRTHVQRPCEDALEHRYTLLAEHDRAEEMFRYVALPESAGRLTSRPPAEHSNRA
jgi:hypothetical protein